MTTGALYVRSSSFPQITHGARCPKEGAHMTTTYTKGTTHIAMLNGRSSKRATTGQKTKKRRASVSGRSIFWSMGSALLPAPQSTHACDAAPNIFALIVQQVSFDSYACFFQRNFTYKYLLRVARTEQRTNALLRLSKNKHPTVLRVA